MNNISSKPIEDVQKSFRKKWGTYNDAIHLIYSIKPMLITESMEKKLSSSLTQLMQIKSTIDGLSDREFQIKNLLKIYKIRLALEPMGKIIESCQNEHKNRMTFLLMGYLTQLESHSSYESNLKPGIMLNKIFYLYLFVPFKNVMTDSKNENTETSIQENLTTIAPPTNM